MNSRHYNTSTTTVNKENDPTKVFDASLSYHKSLLVYPSHWTKARDQALVGWLNTQAEKYAKDPCEIDPFTFKPLDAFFGEHSLTWSNNANLSLYHARIVFLQSFNQYLQQILPFIDVTNLVKHSLGFKLRRLSHLVFHNIKSSVLDSAKQRTQGSGGSSLTITLDNFAASLSLEMKQNTILTSRCIFIQAFQALKTKDTKLLRSCWDGDRVFQVTFRGENGSDAGGVFREGMSRIIEDLFSDQLNLVIPCPNARHEIANNSDKYIPNPRLCNTPLALEMFEFIGKMMGMSLRANLCLPFQFPSIIWKAILSHEVESTDLEAVDMLTWKLLREARQSKSPEAFYNTYGDTLTFVCTSWDGSEVKLSSGRSTDEIVTFETREEYCRLLEQHLLHEFDNHIKSIEKGLFAMVPKSSLVIHTWEEFELLVCGSPTFDLTFWREHTSYGGYSENDETIRLFWKVLGTFTTEEQSGFVRFAWGRSRLPPKAAWFKDMQICKRNSSERSLPVSHTCFFSVELPPYKSEKAMRKGLLTAINFGMVGILNT